MPRGPVADVDGVLVRALRYSTGLTLMEFAAQMGKEKATVQRWERHAVDEITWLGMLTKIGRSPDWQPSADLLTRARTEVEDLRRAAAARKKP